MARKNENENAKPKPAAGPKATRKKLAKADAAPKASDDRAPHSRVARGRRTRR